MTNNGSQILLELIDIVMGNKPINSLSIRDLAFNNYVSSQNMTYKKITSGFVQEIEYLFDKLNLFVYNKDFSNVYYLWNQYKYNLDQKIHNHIDDLENELWGVLLNAELVF